MLMKKLTQRILCESAQRKWNKIRASPRLGRASRGDKPKKIWWNGNWIRNGETESENWVLLGLLCHRGAQPKRGVCLLVSEYIISINLHSSLICAQHHFKFERKFYSSFWFQIVYFLLSIHSVSGIWVPSSVDISQLEKSQQKCRGFIQYLGNKLTFVKWSLFTEISASELQI